MVLMMSVFCLLLFIMVYAIAMNGFQMLTSVELSLKTLIKNAIILTLSSPKTTFIGALLSLGVVGTGIWFFPYSTPLLLLIVFSFSCFVSTFITFPLIQKYIIKR